MPSLKSRIRRLHSDLDHVTRQAVREAVDGVTSHINAVLTDDERTALAADLKAGGVVMSANLFPSDLQETVCTWVRKYGADMFDEIEAGHSYTPALTYPPPPEVGDEVLDGVLDARREGAKRAHENVMMVAWLRGVRGAYEAGRET